MDCSFATLESMLDYLDTTAGVSVPRLTEGRGRFFRQINDWWTEPPSSTLTPRPFVLLPDPTTSLTLPYPRDELSLALMSSSKREAERSEVEGMASAFGISSAVLDRPVTALSGGERLLIALCKAIILSKSSSQVYLCSPTFWLDSSNRSTVESLLDELRSKVADLNILLLEGEEIGGEGAVTFPGDEELALPWHLTASNLFIRFEESNFPAHTPELQLCFTTAASGTSLVSPTLLKGPNGVGKTTLSKILAGVLAPERGTFLIQTAGYTGKARLLLQDSVDHLFGESILDHFERVFKYDPGKKKAALEIFHGISSSFADFFVANPDAGCLGPRTRPTTLLQCKIAFLAERLASEPPLLIIDEPGWGLSRPVADYFVKTACSHAKARKIAVVVISHHVEWVAKSINSILSLEPSHQDGAGSVNLVGEVVGAGNAN